MKKRIWASMLAFMMCMLLVPSATVKADTPAVVNLDVVTDVISGAPVGATYTLELTAMNLSNPMPSGSSGGKKEITVTPGTTGYFGNMTFYDVGEYHYQVKQIDGSNVDYGYDNATYNLTIYILNDTSLNDRKAEIVISKVGSTAKFTKVKYANAYKAANQLTTSTAISTSTATSTGSGGLEPDQQNYTPGGSSPEESSEVGKWLFSPKTGDKDSVWFWILLTMVAVVEVGILTRKRYKRNR